MSTVLTVPSTVPSASQATAGDTQRRSAMVPANRKLVACLDGIAGLLETQGANAFRVRAYRTAADTIRALGHPAAEIVQAGGLEGLDALPHVGRGIARVIRDFVVTGHSSVLDRLRGQSDPLALLASVPGVGPILARRLHEAEIDTLEELESAAHDGRLAHISGFGSKRIAGIRDALATRLGRPHRAAAAVAVPTVPSVATLLEIDRAYRDGDAADRLPRIAPRRFNPTGSVWLPVLHATRDGWHFTALYSNTARAHQLGRTHDWVVIYSDGADADHQHTVVTAHVGRLAGKRVVRGRENECAAYYGEHPER